MQDFFSPHALDVIVQANLNQDTLHGQIGHDEYHFDNNAFEAASAYMDTQRQIIFSALHTEDAETAWQALGRLTHAGQDFYAHSNYIALWREQNPGADPETIPACEETFFSHPDLISGKLYYPLEILSFVPIIKPWVLPLLPKDSHAHMNLDSPEQGEHFWYAYAAAFKRTRFEYRQVQQALTKKLVKLFSGHKKQPSNS